MKLLALKNLGKTNLIFTTIAIVGYITIYFGFVGHIGLGIFQVLLALFLAIWRTDSIKPIKTHFAIYALLVIADLIAISTTNNNLPFMAWGASFLIAFYFTWMMFQLKKHHYENEQ